MEVRDARHLQPLALTTHYEVRYVCVGVGGWVCVCVCVGGGEGECESGRGVCHGAAGVEHAALLLEKMLTLKMFATATKEDLDELQSILDSSKCTDVTVPCVFVTPIDSAAVFSHHSSVSMVTEQGLDVNVEYQPPSYAEDYFFNQISIRRRSSAPVSHPLSPSSPSSPSTPQPPARFMLHIAIENGDLEMSKYLLEKGADVRGCVGVCVSVYVCVCGGGTGGGTTAHFHPSSSTSSPHSLSPCARPVVVQVSYSRMHCIWLLMPTTSLSWRSC